MSALPNRFLELHDSSIAALSQDGQDAVLLLDAYVHEPPSRPGGPGTGWVQPTEFRVHDGSIIIAPSEFPDIVSAGWLECGETRHRNGFALPLSCPDRVHLCFSCAPATCSTSEAPESRSGQSGRRGTSRICPERGGPGMVADAIWLVSADTMVNKG